MIKVALRRNLIYPLLLLICKVTRDAEIYLIKKIFDFNDSLIYTPIMFLAEFFSGLIFCIYEKNIFKKKNPININKKYPILLIKTRAYLKALDKSPKIYFLIFVAALSDFTSFMLRNRMIPKYLNLSITIQNRLGANETIIGAFLYVYLLQIKIFKHHIFTFKITAICLILVIIFEYAFQEITIFLSYKELTISLVVILVSNFFQNFLDTIEKYLLEYDYVNPFKVLMFEGIYGLVLCFSLLFFPEFSANITKVYRDNSTGNFILFIFLLIIYFILCGGKNIYRVITTKIYSPMARVFSDYFLNPFYLIYNFAFEGDFTTNNIVKSCFYFGLNLIISIINSFCGLVFNEFLILFFCGLEYNTFKEVSQRADSKYNLNLIETLFDNNDNNDNNNDNNDNNNDEESSIK